MHGRWDLKLSPRFKDLLSELSVQNAEYLLVGAHALAVYGYIRATSHLDIWVRPSAENASKVLQSLKRFGAPLHDLTADDLSRPGITFQIGLPPHRIDILTEITGVEFESARHNRIERNLGEIVVSVLSREDLILNKRST